MIKNAYACVSNHAVKTFCPTVIVNDMLVYAQSNIKSIYTPPFGYLQSQTTI